MVPEAIVRGLARVRRRERAVALAWGAARLVALAATCLLVACLIDWLIDLRRETPAALRSTLSFLQFALWLGAGAAFLARPLLRARDDDATALWVEEKFPALGHRVISAVQLNRPGAPTEGMSVELIAAVTRQAEDQARALDFASRVDLARLRKGGLLGGAAAAVAAAFALASPATVGALLARQFLADREIPRSVALEAEAARRIRPSGEEVVLGIRARGDVAFEGLSGSVRIYPADRPSESYPLVFDSRDGTGAARFVATIPPAASDFAYRAWLGDGRLRRPAEIVYEPRPVAVKIEGWLVLPRYCGLRPDGTPYEQPRPRGEIAGPLGSSARVWIEAQKPLARAALEHLGRSMGEGIAEPVTRRTELALREGAREADGVFELRPDETAYRVVLEDRNAFLNTSPPRRGVTVVPEEPPRVVLLPERFAFPGEVVIADEADVEGMPIPIGGAVRIAFYAAHPFGLERARLAWRVVKAGQSSEEGAAAAEVPWSYLPLKEVRGTEESGPFDLRLGLFRNSGFREPVEFHPVPSPDPERILGRVEGGGCFDFQTRPLEGVQPGDQLEIFIEVFSRNPAMAGQPGRSETRTKAFVTQPQFVTWVLETLRHENRIRQLESRQRGVFAPEGTDR